MVTRISISHYFYNIDVYINGILQKPVEKEKSKSLYIYNSESREKIFLKICQNDKNCNKFSHISSYYDFGYEFGELYFWPSNIYCQYYAQLRAGSDIALCVCTEKNKYSPFIQGGKFIIQSTSESNVKNEKHSTLIPRKNRFKFFLSSILCQFVCNSLLLSSLLAVVLLSFDINSKINFFDNFSQFDKIGFWVLIVYHVIRFSIYIFIHTKILFKDDGTYYSKE